MAELHGELIELQEALQKQLVSKDHDIQLMKQELISLRGPLPENVTQSDSKSSESLYVVHPTLINIWIPSVFLKGRGTEAYHLYQVIMEYLLLTENFHCRGIYLYQMLRDLSNSSKQTHYCESFLMY